MAFKELVNSIRKFGAVEGLNGTGDVYDNGSSVGTYPFPAAASTASVVSTDADDDGTPTPAAGARTVTISGLDANYEQIEETVTMEGLTPVVTDASFFRVYRVRVATVGASLTNEGVITVTVDSGIVAQIGVGNGKTLQAIYTVPAGKKLLIFKWLADTAAVVTSTFSLLTRPEGMAWLLEDRKYVISGGSIEHDYGDRLPLEVMEKTDVRVEAITGGASNTSAAFDGLLIPQNLPAGS